MYLLYALFVLIRKSGGTRYNSCQQVFLQFSKKTSFNVFQVRIRIQTKDTVQKNLLKLCFKVCLEGSRTVEKCSK